MKTFAARLCATLSLLFVNCGNAATYYEMVDLGAEDWSAAHSINNNGDVVGVGPGGAFLYRSGVLINLGGVVSFDINDRGDVVGIVGAGMDHHAFLLKDGVMHDLGGMGDRVNSQGTAVNEKGDVVGVAYPHDAPAVRAFLYSDGAMVDLGAFRQDGDSWAFGINDSGHVVGYAQTSSGTLRAFLYKDGAMQDVGAGDDSVAKAINNRGQITGGAAGRAFLYSQDGGTPQILILSDSFSEGLGINENGEVVGRASFGGFKFINGKMLDLNSLLFGGSDNVLRITWAHAINNGGYIAGTAHDIWTGFSRAVMLRPVPVTDVSIKINPSKFPNNVSLSSARVVPVGIISTATFDATKVDPATVILASGDVRRVDKKRKATKYSCQQADVNSDGLSDLLCNVETDQMSFPGDFSAVLWGKTFAGERIRGEDQLVIVQ